MSEAVFWIRPFRPSDGAALAALHRGAILATSEEFYSLEERESWAFGIDAALYGTADEDLEVAVDRGHRPVAFCSRASDEVRGLYVDVGWQGRGVGKLLLARAEETIAASGITISKIKAAISAVPFYEARGYAVTSLVDHKTRGGLLLKSAYLAKPIGK